MVQQAPEDDGIEKSTSEGNWKEDVCSSGEAGVCCGEFKCC